MSDSEKRVNKNASDIPSIKRVTRKFLEVSRNSRAKQRQRNVQKSVLHVKGAFLLIRPIVVVVFLTVLVAFTAYCQGGNRAKKRG